MQRGWFFKKDLALGGKMTPPQKCPTHNIDLIDIEWFAGCPRCCLDPKFTKELLVFLGKEQIEGLRKTLRENWIVDEEKP